ncbi:unnamed protein product [Sphagnum balticum]
MTPTGAGTTNLTWSSCSLARYQAKLASLGAQTCLSPIVSRVRVRNRAQFACSQTSLSAVNIMPGQTTTNEAQCQALLGSCARFYPDQLNNCMQLLCTSSQGVSVMAYGFARLDGSYCGPGTVCMSGVCVTPSPPLSLPNVNGGWSPWMTTVDSMCGGSGCSPCAVVGQVE